MFDYTAIRKATENLKTIDQKGKPYVMVNERVKAFRELEPMGSITTEILSLADGVVVMKATVCDADGNVLSTGTACEVEGVGFVNKTSYIENCETSCIGRALGFIGIGIEEGIASAEEVEIAIAKKDLASTVERKTFQDLCEMHNVSPTEMLMKETDWKQGERLTKKQFADVVKALEKLNG